MPTSDSPICEKCGLPTVPREQGGDEDDRVCPRCGWPGKPE